MYDLKIINSLTQRKDTNRLGHSTIWKLNCGLHIRENKNVQEFKGPMKLNIPYLIFAILLYVNTHIFAITNSISINERELVQP